MPKERANIETIYHLRYSRIVVSRRRNNWKGWIDPKDVPPEMMERFRRKTELYHHYAKNLDGKEKGTGNYMLAHMKAEHEVGLSAQEMEILRRLHPDAPRDIHERYKD